MYMYLNKKLIILCAAFMSTVLLTMCSGYGQSAETDSVAPEYHAESTDTDESSQMNTEPESIEPLPYVTTLVHKSDEYERYNENGVREALVKYSLRLPELHISEELDAEFQKEIERRFLNNAEWRINNETAVFDIEYYVHYYKDILSVTIYRCEGFSADNETYYSVTYDVAKKTKLTLADALEIAGYKDDPLLDVLANLNLQFYFTDEGELIIREHRIEDDFAYYRYYNLTKRSMSDRFIGEVYQQNESK